MDDISSLNILIPARRNSKGFPFKNRKLLPYTLDIIPNELKNNVTISTDDEEIINSCEQRGIDFIIRDKSIDDVGIKPVIEDYLEKRNIDKELVLMLYLTYPERKWYDISKAIDFMNRHDAHSLLCKKEPKTHPYLCLEEKSNNKGKDFIGHDLYRRQQFPKCFELSHYISLFTSDELPKLNNRLFNTDTVFMPIDDKVDVDYENDLKKF